MARQTDARIATTSNRKRKSHVAGTHEAETYEAKKKQPTVYHEREIETEARECQPQRTRPLKESDTPTAHGLSPRCGRESERTFGVSCEAEAGPDGSRRSRVLMAARAAFLLHFRLAE